MSTPSGRPSQRLARVSARTGRPIVDSQRGHGAASKPDGAVFAAAERATQFLDHLRTHYRETRRTDVQIPVRITLLIEDNAVYDVGTATVKNISPSGALLADVSLPRRSYPTVPFKLEILMQSGAYAGIGLEAVPIRFEPKHRGIGVKYSEVFVTSAE